MSTIRAAVLGGILSAIVGLVGGFMIARITGWNIFALTVHQLDVIRTFGSIFGAIGGLLGGVGAIGAFLARYWAKKAANQTSTTHYVNGEQRVIPVVEYAKHASIASEASRQETADFRNEWVKGVGRRRLPTTEIPRLSTYIGDSNE